jgi:hypothetical protein
MEEPSNNDTHEMLTEILYTISKKKLTPTANLLAIDQQYLTIKYNQKSEI